MNVNISFKGTEGVRQMLEILKEEFSETLALAGETNQLQ